MNCPQPNPQIIIKDEYRSLEVTVTQEIRQCKRTLLSEEFRSEDRGVARTLIKTGEFWPISVQVSFHQLSCSISNGYPSTFAGSQQTNQTWHGGKNPRRCRKVRMPLVLKGFSVCKVNQVASQRETQGRPRAGRSVQISARRHLPVLR